MPSSEGRGRIDVDRDLTRWLKASDGFPQYGYGVLQAVTLAQRLGVPAISALELGVAGGNGLVVLERLAEELGRESNVHVLTVGFDLGTGMPPPLDHRDNPYIWQRGFFTMDEGRLRSRLTQARLVIGDIAETGPSFMASGAPPIGFISFDLDYYSSTVSAMRGLIEDDLDRYLPRVLCYFDDTVGPHDEMHSEFTGELLAIREFNNQHTDRKIAKINGLRSKFPGEVDPWVEGIYVLHLFSHPRYNDYVFSAPTRQFPLDR
ncbi:MAG TPA: hypothetical protein VHJ83_11935 [Micromonosporaceae bacterium]|nr:hypothetical protein [Micromonosporaceae bacterium]